MPPTTSLRRSRLLSRRRNTLEVVPTSRQVPSGLMIGVLYATIRSGQKALPVHVSQSYGAESEFDHEDLVRALGYYW